MLTDEEALFDFNADARDRITAWINSSPDVAPGLAKTLEKSIDMAGGQLEHMKPGVMGTTQKGVYIGSVTMVQQRTILIVLANRRKVFQMGLQLLPEGPGFGDAVRSCIDYVRQHTDEIPPAGAVLRAMDHLINTLGAGIGKKHQRDLAEEHCARILGVLFAPIPADNLNWMYQSVDWMVGKGWCPAVVGVTGPGSRSPKLLSGAWPVCFPLAPYVDAVLPPEPGGGQEIPVEGSGFGLRDANSGNKYPH